MFMTLNPAIKLAKNNTSMEGADVDADADAAWDADADATLDTDAKANINYPTIVASPTQTSYYVYPIPSSYYYCQWRPETPCIHNAKTNIPMNNPPTYRQHATHNKLFPTRPPRYDPQDR